MISTELGASGGDGTVKAPRMAPRTRADTQGSVLPWLPPLRALLFTVLYRTESTLPHPCQHVVGPEFAWRQEERG